MTTILRSLRVPPLLTSANLSRIMSSTTTHMERTNGSSRDPGLRDCTVSSITDISPTVKLLKLAPVPKQQLTFKPGQWVDFFIPGTDMIGGYSMCSDPRSPLLELAIKYSTHPPAHWVHKFCKAGDDVQVRVGGDVHLEPGSGAKAVLLVGGGIGINPLLSMIKAGLYSSTKYHLLYSAGTLEELIFWYDLEEMSVNHENFTVEYFLTRETVKQLGSNNFVKFQSGRITPETINKLVDDWKNVVGADGIRCFLCGPPPMIDYLSKNVEIKCEYEKWW